MRKSFNQNLSRDIMRLIWGSGLIIIKRSYGFFEIEGSPSNIKLFERRLGMR